MKTPKLVDEATKVYREESDPTGVFFQRYVHFSPESKTSRKMLRGAYSAFCDGLGIEALGYKRFNDRLKNAARASGVDLVDGGTIRVRRETGMAIEDAWSGVRLKTDAERTAAIAWSPVKL